MTSSISAQLKWTLETFSRYWPGKTDLVLDLLLPQLIQPQKAELPPALCKVMLPEWASDCGVRGSILIPCNYLNPGNSYEWERADWLGILFWYLHGVAEREYEKRFQPIHSYKFRLKGWDSEMWDYAWGNRVALFIRRWVAKNLDSHEENIFGKLPLGEIWITHDVDAISKTFSIRIKQSVFQIVICGKSIFKRNWKEAVNRLKKATSFLLSSDNYLLTHKVIEIERDLGMRSVFLFYGGESNKSLKKAFMDPGYSISDSQIMDELNNLKVDGWGIGLHPSYTAWKNFNELADECKRVECATGNKVQLCRQHWLMFGWASTWRAQEKAGIEWDSTLAFNDYTGLRNGVALDFHPWNSDTNSAMALKCVPTILMDSHLYDYNNFDESDRTAKMSRWLDEIKYVGGSVAINWHPHTLSLDYGWGSGFKTLLHLVKRSGLKTRKWD